MSSSPSPSHPSHPSNPSFHFRPHSAHLDPAHAGPSSPLNPAQIPPAPSAGLSAPSSNAASAPDGGLEEDDHDYESLGVQGFGVNMLAGALAGISEHAAIFPVDSIKVSLAFCSNP